jgi:hypothetical protein
VVYYESSAEFTDEFYAAIQKLREAADLFNKPEMAGWFKLTDQNYDTRTVAEFNTLNTMLKAALIQADILDSELERAE